MNLSIKIEDVFSIPGINIDYFEYKSSLLDFYSRAKLTVKDMAKDTFNYIKIGTPITIEFFDGDISYINNMKVLKYNKLPGESPVDTLELTLVSAWYFDCSMEDTARDGNIGNIFNKIAQDKFSKHVKIDIGSTEEAPSRRYQIGEEIHSFMERIIKYGIKGNFPVYLYTDAKGILNLKGINDFINKEAYYLAVPDTSDVAMTVSKNVNEKTIRLKKYRFSTNIENAHSLFRTKFTTEHFIASVSNVANDISLTDPEFRNPQSLSYSPPKTKIRTWEYTPEDALAISMRESFEASLSVFYLSAVVTGFVFSGLNVGDMIKVDLPFKKVKDVLSGKEQNLGEGSYLITETHYVYSNNEEYTKIKASQFSTE